MKLKILVKSFCEKGKHPCSSYGISIFHSKYCQLVENVSGNSFWLVYCLRCCVHRQLSWVVLMGCGTRCPESTGAGSAVSNWETV